MTRITRSAVAEATRFGEFRNRLTVAVETPAARATSSIEGGRVLFGLGVGCGAVRLTLAIVPKTVGFEIAFI
jgi:hypothetical protein